MKYILFSLLFFSKSTFACLLYNDFIYFNEESSSDYGFSFESFESILCSECVEVSLKGPASYEGYPVSSYKTTVYLNGKFSHSSIHSPTIELDRVKYVGVFSKESNYSYEVQFFYGRTRCPKHHLVFKGGANAL